MKLSPEQQMLIDILLAGEDLIAVEVMFYDKPALAIVANISDNVINGRKMTLPVALLLDPEFVVAHHEKLKSMDGTSPYRPSEAELQVILHPEKSAKA